MEEELSSHEVVVSTEFNEDFQCMSGSIFLDFSGRKILWKLLDSGTKSDFGAYRSVINSALVYQGSDEEETDDAGVVYKSYVNSSDITPMVLPPGANHIRMFADSGGQEELFRADFTDHEHCLRYAIIAESDTSDFNAPVSVHEASEHPHLTFGEDIMTKDAFAMATHAPLMAPSHGRLCTDTRSGVALCAMTEATAKRDLLAF